MAARIKYKKGQHLHGTILSYLCEAGTHILPSGGKKRKIKCLCECGETTVLMHSALPKTRSCGCLRVEFAKRTTHGGFANGKTGKSGNDARLIRIYEGMLARCNNPNRPSYAKYGGMGIEVCKEWQDSYIKFRDWALANGYADNLSIDRMNIITPHYCPENCQWVTELEQSINRRGSYWWVVNGKVFNSANDASDYYNKHISTIQKWCGTILVKGISKQQNGCYVIPKYYDCSLLKTPKPIT